jgi:hypothetical protein
LTTLDFSVIESMPGLMKEKKIPSHGGKREGAGRPPIGVHKVQLTLDDETIDKGTNIGEGNLSRGVRIAVKDYKRKSGRKKPV